MGFLGTNNTQWGGIGQGLNSATDNLIKLYMFGKEQKQRKAERTQLEKLQTAQIAQLEQTTLEKQREMENALGFQKELTSAYTPIPGMSEDRAISQTAFTPNAIEYRNVSQPGMLPEGFGQVLPDQTQRVAMMTPQGTAQIEGLMQPQGGKPSSEDIMRIVDKYLSPKEAAAYRIALMKDQTVQDRNDMWQLINQNRISATTQNLQDKIATQEKTNQDKLDMMKFIALMKNQTENKKVEAGKMELPTATRAFKQEYNTYLNQFRSDEAAGKYPRSQYPNGAIPLSEYQYLQYKINQGLKNKQTLKQTPTGKGRKDLKSTAEDIVNQNLGTSQPSSNRQTGSYKGTRAYTDDGGKTFYDMQGRRLN